MDWRGVSRGGSLSCVAASVVLWWLGCGDADRGAQGAGSELGSDAQGQPAMPRMSESDPADSVTSTTPAVESGTESPSELVVTGNLEADDDAGSAIDAERPRADARGCIGEPPNDPQRAVEAGGCRFEYLGDWIRCEHAGYPNLENVVEATELLDCMEACAQREDCVAVTDWFWIERPDLGCGLYLSTCDAPCEFVWASEDAGRSYRKVCPAD